MTLALKTFIGYNLHYVAFYTRRCREHAEGQRLAKVAKVAQDCRTTKMKERCKALVAYNQQLAFRRALDVEGFSSDIAMLRKQQVATSR